MPRASKQVNAAEPVAEKAAKEPAAPKIPVFELPRSISVRQLAELMQVDSILIIKQLMRNGIMANINQIIDYETAAPIVAGFGFKPHLKPLKEQQMATAAEESKKLKRRYGKEAANLLAAPACRDGHGPCRPRQD